MKFSPKDYKILKTKNFIKENCLFILFNGINPSTSNWTRTEQELQKIKFNCYKIFNRTSKKIIRVSTYKVIEPAINGVTFLIKPLETNNELSKHLFTNTFGPLLFTMLVVKLNNKAYTTRQLKHASTLDYKQMKLTLYQYGLTNIKSYYAINSK